MADPYALDPFSTVVRLALLPYMSRGVKIGIVNNRIVYYRPNWFDLICRTLMSLANRGCTKHTLFHLRLPFERAIRWYQKCAPEVFVAAAQGLAMLSETYSDDPTAGNVTATINAIAKLLERPEDLDPEDLSNKPALLRLKRGWTTEEIEIVARQINLLKTTEDADRVETMIRCIDEFVSGKEPVIFDIIRACPVAASSSTDTNESMVVSRSDSTTSPKPNKSIKRA